MRSKFQERLEHFDMTCVTRETLFKRQPARLNLTQALVN
jgi:hypothetical protein